MESSNNFSSDTGDPVRPDGREGVSTKAENLACRAPWQSEDASAVRGGQSPLNPMDTQVKLIGDLLFPELPRPNGVEVHYPQSDEERYLILTSLKRRLWARTSGVPFCLRTKRRTPGPGTSGTDDRSL